MCSYCSQAAFQIGNYSAEVPQPKQANGGSFPGLTGDANVDGLISGYAWQTKALTWRIPISTAQYDTNSVLGGIQYDDIARVNNWQAPTATMTTASAFIFNKMFAAVSGLTFTAVAASDISADLTIGRSTAVLGFDTAYAYYPYGPGTGLSGDSWFSTAYDAHGAAFRLDAPKLGGYNWLTYIHEFGHNMGLKHGHETDGPSGAAMNANRDSMEFSVMTYRGYIGASTSTGYQNESYGFAQTLMMYDIAALQVMYGANFAENAGNTTYTFSATTGEMLINGVGQGVPGDGTPDANRIFRTVWDGNGVDTYDLSNYTSNLTIDLTPGGWSVFSTEQLAYLGGGNFARGNLFNALQFNGDVRSLIENAVGGSGNDTITGNVANNTLNGGAGTDTINGGGGLDTIYGGVGTDILNGGAESDTIYGGIAATDPNDVNDTIHGNSGDDLIYGNGGDDFLYGDQGLDTIYGGGGGDTIYGGIGLADPIDSADTIYGNAGNDFIYGNGGDDILYGSEGLDTIYGGGGSDTIYGGIGLADPVDAADTIYGNAGNDLIYGNGGSDILFGNEDSDTVYGGGGIDTIYGGTGNDILYGNADSDRFVFDTALNAATNVDGIMDFQIGSDKIALSQGIFAGILGTLDASEFQIGNADAATDRICYNPGTGQLFYDADGNGTGSGLVLFATVTAGTVLTINDFVMVA
jgi:serralysin